MSGDFLVRTCVGLQMRSSGGFDENIQYSGPAEFIGNHLGWWTPCSLRQKRIKAAFQESELGSTPSS